MRLSLENLISVVLLLLGEAWFLRDLFGHGLKWDSSIAFATIFVAFFSKENIKRRLDVGQQSTQHDVELFKKFLHDFPFRPSVEFLKDYDFGDSFPKTSLSGLLTFSVNWDSVELEFQDKALEEKRKELLKSANNLHMEISRLTVPVGDGSFSSVFPDRAREAGPRPDWVIEDAKTLNNLARNFVPEYEAFVRICRKKLIK